jgi:hypothetical protein
MLPFIRHYVLLSAAFGPIVAHEFYNSFAPDITESHTTVITVIAAPSPSADVPFSMTAFQAPVPIKTFNVIATIFEGVEEQGEDEGPNEWEGWEKFPPVRRTTIFSGVTSGRCDLLDTTGSGMSQYSRAFIKGWTNES